MLGTLFLFLALVLLLLEIIFWFTPTNQSVNNKKTEEKHEGFPGNQIND